MKIITATLLMVIMCMGGAQAADGQWEKPPLDDCSNITAAQTKNRCERMNYCVNSTTDACSVHVGDQKDKYGGQFLLEKCFQERMHVCVGALDNNNNHGSTNVTDNPQAWDCMMSDGSRASDTYCRDVNYCFDAGARECSERIGARKYTPAGQGEMMGCNQEKQLTCLRAVN